MLLEVRDAETYRTSVADPSLEDSSSEVFRRGVYFSLLLALSVVRIRRRQNQSIRSSCLHIAGAGGEVPTTPERGVLRGTVQTAGAQWGITCVYFEVIMYSNRPAADDSNHQKPENHPELISVT